MVKELISILINIFLTVILGIIGAAGIIGILILLERVRS